MIIKIIVTIGLILICFFLYMIYLAFHDKITYENFQFDQLPETFDSFTIFFIADIHRRTIREQTISKIKHVHIVLLGGDIIERNASYETLQKNIQTLKNGRHRFILYGAIMIMKRFRQK